MSAERIPASVWTRPRRRKEHSSLTREQIVAEALALLDADGIEALSMRKLGARLGVGATSLYWHVAHKDELIELVVDEVYGEIEVPPAHDLTSWRMATVLWGHSLRALILRHPWMASVLGDVGISRLGPNLMRMNDAMLAMFEPAGYGTTEASRAIGTIVGYVTGVAISEAAWLRSLARDGLTEQAWLERYLPTAEAAAEDYPRIQVLLEADRNRDLSRSRDADFAYGLDRVLDGLQASVTGAPTTR